MKRIDLNVDIGEGFPYDEELLEFATSANVCCGEHAGSWELTQTTIELCRRKGVRIGAHPGYPDRAGLGRRSAAEAGAPENEWAARTAESFNRFVSVVVPAYLKPHGALYNESAVRTEDLPAQTVARMVGTGIALMGLPGTAHVELAAFGFIAEGFADRRYRSDGSLLPRTEPGALLEDPEEIRAQVLALAERVDSICLHGDNPRCLEFAEMVHRTLTITVTRSAREPGDPRSQRVGDVPECPLLGAPAFRGGRRGRLGYGGVPVGQLHGGERSRRGRDRVEPG